MKLRQVAKTVDDTMGLGEAILVAVVGRAASWIASIPAAVMVARAVQEIFEIDPFWAAVTAAALELVGMTTSNLWLTAKEWNATKRKSDPEANTALAFALMVVYFVADFLIIAALVTINFAKTGDVAGFTALLFPVLAVVGIVALNERAGHYKRVGEAEKDRQEKRAACQDKQLQLAQAVQDREIEREVERKGEEAQRQALAAQRRTLAALGQEAATLKAYLENPGATQAQIAAVVGCSRRTVGNHLSKLEQAGAIRRNGQGIEVLVDSSLMSEGEESRECHQ